MLAWLDVPEALRRAEREDPRQKSSKEPEELETETASELSQEAVQMMRSCSAPAAAAEALEFQCRSVALQLESLAQALAQVPEEQEEEQEEDMDQCHR